MVITLRNNDHENLIGKEHWGAVVFLSKHLDGVSGNTLEQRVPCVLGNTLEQRVLCGWHCLVL